MRSMTAFGYSEYSCDEYVITMELKSYNNRFLEISYSAPPVLSPYEQTITEIIRQNAQRGHIDISIRLKNLKGGSDISVDENAAEAYLEAFGKINELFRKSGIQASVRLADIISQEGVLSNMTARTVEYYREGLDACTLQVMNQFNSSKDREGTVTKKDLLNKINSIQKSLDIVSANASELEQQIKSNLTEKIHEMLGDQNYDENRILTEVAVMLMRYTINEETVRLGAHIAEFRKLLDSEEPVGKRMDFLSQEMNREINTIGSKSQMVNINFEVVNMKDCLENIREQIRNIE